MYIGKPVSSRMLRAVRRLCGHESTGPTGVLDQSMVRISVPISPPPARTSNGWVVTRRSYLSRRREEISSFRRDVVGDEICQFRRVGGFRDVVRKPGGSRFLAIGRVAIAGDGNQQR